MTQPKAFKEEAKEGQPEVVSAGESQPSGSEAGEAAGAKIVDEKSTEDKNAGARIVEKTGTTGDAALMPASSGDASPALDQTNVQNPSDAQAEADTKPFNSQLAVRVSQILLFTAGVWWAYFPAQERLDQAQVPGFLIALAISWTLTPEIARRAIRLGLVDKPGEARRIHTTPVPRLGGVGVYISVVATVTMLIAIAGRLPKDARGAEGIIGIAVGGTLVFVLGLIDDLDSIKAKIKLVIQVLAGCTAYALGVRIKTIPMPEWVHLDLGPLHLHGQIELGMFGLPLTVLWLVGVANAVNLIDGMDGLAAGVSAISALTIWSVALGSDIARPYAALMAAVVAGALLGFLRWNFNPARIFLGDSGAYLTGFILAAISITGVIKGVTAGTVIVPTILLVGLILFFPLLDTSWAIVRRAVKGVSIFSPDRLHIHHRLLDRGFNQKKVAYIIYGVSAALGLVATCFVHQQWYFLKVVGGVLALAWFFAEVLNRHRQKGRS